MVKAFTSVPIFTNVWEVTAQKYRCETLPLKAQKAEAAGPDPSLNIKTGWVQCLVAAQNVWDQLQGADQIKAAEEEGERAATEVEEGEEIKGGAQRLV